MRLTLGDVRSQVAKSLGFCASDSRVADYINEAIQRLVESGDKWVGTTQRYNFCTDDGCIVLPRQIETVEAYWVCQQPGTIRNGWYEAIGDGPGLLDDASCAGNQLLDRGDCVSFDNVIGSGKKLKVYADVTEAAGAKILLQFYDENGNFVRTQDADGAWLDGEYVNLATGGTLSSKYCMANGLVAIQKPATNGVIRLYEYDTVALTQRLIGFYEPDETRPTYRRYLIPSFANIGCCSSSSSSSDCASKNVTVIGRLRFIKAVNDNDWLLISSTPALKYMSMAIRKAESEQWEESGKFEATARRILQGQLGHYRGDAAVEPVRFVGSETWGAAVTTIY